MHHKSTVISLSVTLILVHLTIDLVSAIPVDSKTSSFYNQNAFESNPSSSSLNEPAKSEISETVSKILRLMHSLSNKSILVAPQPNYNLNDVKKENNLKFKTMIESKVEESNRQFTERLGNKFNFKKMTNKFINENIDNENLNERSVNNERFNDNFNENIQVDNLNNNNNNENNLFMKKRLMHLPVSKEYSLSAKYPIDDKIQRETTTSTSTTISEFIRTNPLLKLNEMMIRQANSEEESPRLIKNVPAYIKQFSRFNEQIDLENKENKDSGKLSENEQVEFSKDLKRNLYDMVENEDEDNLGEEEHVHNYDISLLSDRELNRTLFDIQWLLNQNLSKQEMESKFSSKVRNNRNKIAQRMEYFDKLYRNIHQLSNNAPTNVKRGEGPPQLSVVSPLDILRDKLILEIARRKIEQSKSQMKENEDYLKKIG